MFRNSHLTGETWSKKTCCIAQLYDSAVSRPLKVVATLSGESRSAEERMIEKLEAYLSKLLTSTDEKLFLQIYLNYAPSNICTNQLIAFQEKHRLTVNIMCVSDYYKNEEGLRLLLAHEKILLEAFNEQVWEKFRESVQCLPLPDWDYSEEMKKRDRLTSSKFQKLSPNFQKRRYSDTNIDERHRIKGRKLQYESLTQ